ncbi:uncharacterized protein LOC100821264 [Brachypodium distachyon]|uniref:Uncharacterized protein n=1 Tax=Brachypodium distachyon TaxID=15368 RepID=I1H162_BRADI|nr:uncharacterized protein LOC100821264 [Brachypodium distachyon]PNT76567.1 hypothetical protein BRADI_1g49707v3 [Brachypodium distachyon]|eukprot:XP_003561117.1 uncharacterized protein LOC100821264 [Brachypodium distachyon]
MDAYELPFAVHIPPALLHAAAVLALAAAAHFLHLPSLLLYAVHTYIHPDAVPSKGPRAMLRPPNSGPPNSRRGAPASAFDDDGSSSNSSQLYRLRLSHGTLASRPHFAGFHLALLLPLAVLPPALLLPASQASPVAPLLPLAFLFAALLRHAVTLPSAASRTPGPHLASALAVLLVATVLSSSPFAGSLASLAALPASRFARAFWLGTDQPRTGLAVLASSAPARLLLHLAVLVSSAASVLQLCGFLNGPELEVKVLAAAAGLQLLASRAAVQMYLNEAVFCWYQRLHVNRSPDTEYGRAKVFLHNHHLCVAATQFVVPPLLVLSLLALWWVQGKDFFEGVEGLDWLVGWSVAMKEAALLAARWVVAVWSAVTVGTLVCYKRGWLFVS